jgi:hypothetical protein
VKVLDFPLARRRDPAEAPDFRGYVRGRCASWAELLDHGAPLGNVEREIEHVLCLIRVQRKVPRRWPGGAV